MPVFVGDPQAPCSTRPLYPSTGAQTQQKRYQAAQFKKSPSIKSHHNLKANHSTYRLRTGLRALMHAYPARHPRLACKPTSYHPDLTILVVPAAGPPLTASSSCSCMFLHFVCSKVYQKCPYVPSIELMKSWQWRCCMRLRGCFAPIGRKRWTFKLAPNDQRSWNSAA
eukprot:1159038-Pelagomonas_calceolata.AAC.3